MNKTIKQTAIEELENEIFRENVEAEKIKIRKVIEGYRWWHKFIPFTIKFEIKRRQSWK